MELLLALAFVSYTRPDLVAQAATEAGPWLTLVNLGVGGIFLWAFTAGKVHSDKELQRVIDRCDAEFHRVAGKLDDAEAELAERNREAREMLVPTLVKATEILARYLDRRDHTPNPPSKGRA